ncbi:MAG: SHOCT-like domain-containing protein [Candidatus Acidiferrales bacterium]
MSEERKKILEMLAQGKITADDAARLLDKISGAAFVSGTAGSQTGATAAPAAASGSASEAKRSRYLRIQVERPGREDTNIRVPLSFVRGGRHWMAVLPNRVAEKLSEHGIDFASFEAMNDQDFQRTLDQMNIDIESDGGKKVRIFCE